MFGKIKESVARFFLKRRLIKMLDKLKGFIDGKKTYITVVIGIIVAIAGYLYGPINVGPVDIPSVSSQEVWTIVWNGLMFLFLRKGVKKAEK